MRRDVLVGRTVTAVYLHRVFFIEDGVGSVRLFFRLRSYKDR